MTGDAAFAAEELGSLRLLDGLPDEVLAWLAERGRRVRLEAGEHMFERGQPADAMWIVVKGLIQGFEEHGGQWLLVATTGPGEVTGMLPFSRMTHYPRYTLAAEPSEVFRLEAALFKELLDRSEELGRRLVAQMSDRVRGDVRLEQQHEKMVALGQLSAGLAHELNNPAAAVRRAAARLSERRDTLGPLLAALSAHQVGAAGIDALFALRQDALSGEGGSTSFRDRSMAEDAISDWLEARGVPEPWDTGATFAEAGLTLGGLAAIAEAVPPEALADALTWLGAEIESERILGEIRAASGRISELVESIRIYSHMDRSAEHKPTDVRQGLDNTVTMLGHKLKKKSVQLTREYQEDLPLLPANAGELNQVWTNLIDNALDAIEEGGSLTLRVATKDRWIQVDVIDDGPGIPEELRARIFEPFFTTKDVGEGTGLGLGIARRIVRTHEGHIEVRSRPGETVMCVRLPIERTRPVDG